MLLQFCLRNWPCGVQVLFGFVLFWLFPPFIRAHSAVDSSVQFVLPSNESSEFILGFGNDPFGERMTETKNPHTSGRQRSKRSVVHLYNMVNCATGCDPLSYKGYGCYCGFLGSGYVVDGIDRCCQMHDWCYDSSGCPMFLEYFVPYLWKCYHRQPLCGIEVGSPGSCGQRLCHCDQLLAQCLQRYPCPSTKAICTSSPWRLLQNIFML